MTYKEKLINYSNVCLSGGADGADLQWGMNAGKFGHNVIHWIFEKHKSTAPKEELVELTNDLLLEADPYLKIANKTLKRKFPTKNDFTNNLLRRNFYQVRWAEAVYAVSSFDKDGMVAGGTAWAVQLYLDRFLVNNEPLHTCNLYVYDQVNEQWFKWINDWVKIQSVPTPRGIYAGVGSRDLKETGKSAIRGIFGY